MKPTHAPSVAALLMLGLGLACVPGLAQLPPTNMGKYVHQPGDNQYSDQTQQSRHGAPAPVRQVQMAPVSAYTPAPAAPKPDPTLEPIAADEPVPIAGFPPLPDRLDLPVGNQAAWTRSSGGGGGGGYGGGGGGGGYTGGGGGYEGPAPGQAGGGGGAPSPTFHQHYGHVQPGAYQQQKSQGYYKAVNPGMPSGGGGGSAPGMAGAGGGGGGYYKARSPGVDSYSTSTGGGGSPGMSPPSYSGASAKDFKALGREPKLNERQEQTQTPDAPTPVVVSQSTTQDLSLPEDEFSYRHPSQSAASKFGKSVGRMIKAPINSIGGMAGVRF